MPRPLSDDLRDAIRLRRWAWMALSGRSTDAPAASPLAWQLFLDREACAAALARLPGLLLPEIVRARAAQETGTILLAQAELRLAAQLIAKAGLEVLPLKGTAALLDPAALPLKDVDLLAPRGNGPAVLAALAGGGRLPVHRPTYLHATVASPDGVPIEVHGTIWSEARCTADDLWRRGTPHPSIAGLRLLAPADHLWLLLVHVTLVHPTRSGRLRDRLLIRAAATPQALSEVRDRIARNRAAAPLNRELESVLGDEPGRRAFDRTAGHWYYFDARLARTRLPQSIRLPCAGWATTWIVPSALRRPAWRALIRIDGESALPFVGLLERRLPWLGRTIHLAVRLTWSIPFALAGAILAARARRATTAALDWL
ncbi:MAG: nucleotidyltransferase family protein [Gemmatimonadales bacterium]